MTPLSSPALTPIRHPTIYTVPAPTIHQDPSGPTPSLARPPVGTWLTPSGLPSASLPLCLLSLSFYLPPLSLRVPFALFLLLLAPYYQRNALLLLPNSTSFVRRQHTRHEQTSIESQPPSSHTTAAKRAFVIHTLNLTCKPTTPLPTLPAPVNYTARSVSSLYSRSLLSLSLSLSPSALPSMPTLIPAPSAGSPPSNTGPGALGPGLLQPSQLMTT
ncbi:hypothetical protein NLG97_g8900 [Lecanicillium saksenae]|uniref:Uncharacterized protein n=1 Tax=Lecanicillium saksenae TaxID=468837 RepID=A0ACC1QJJ5_9HYPO|nr:hypothetical protein NLG97_g8900 [Lecanicillium saksenae]